ncbi:proline--tRNA ligase [Spiroplasma endosymbiont of Aspidapion aeneum]|uniref:proline--tRNA ligase n=1 Tax=Spiroplasma endosymbiont of Aspidapion aeneum TaxID=3066276 RepID=UPI00313EB8DC
MAKNIEKITSRDIDFAKWYTDVVQNSELVEYGPVKGTMIIKPYGFAIWENIVKFLDIEFKKQKVQNVYFPMLIPEELFNKEKEHIDGFAPELYTITKIGENNLQQKLFLRPTSEVLIANYWSKAVKSYRDLPLLFNQFTNVLRCEKTTRPFLRSSEFLWNEGHTVHSDETEAENFAIKIWNVYKRIVEDVLMIPTIAGIKTRKERFAGAETTYTIETMMYDGQALQSATSHYFGSNFTKAYNVKFQNKNQKEEFAYTTSWGMSTRIIGAIIMSHSDDFGLVLPSKIAPIQIRVIKIKDEEEVNKIAKLIENKLANYRIDMDESDKSFGFKISDAEIKGIPLRIEIGPKELESNSVVISRRDLRTKVLISINNIEQYVYEQLNEYDKNLFTIARKRLDSRIYKLNTISEYKENLKTKIGFALVPFCGDVECENSVKEQTSTNSRCISGEENKKEIKCFNCNKLTKQLVYFSRAY